MARIKKITTTVTEEVIEDGPKQTYVCFVLDKSSSMWPIAKQTISGFNENLSTLQREGELAGEIFLSLITFNGVVDVTYANKKVKSAKPLNDIAYKPNGSTALYDAIGQALDLLAPYDNGQGDRAFLVTIFTDGDENSSRTWTSEKLKSRVAELEATGRWTIPLSAANVDLNRMAAGTGIQQTYAYDASPIGTQVMYASSSAGLRNYVANRALNLNPQDFYEGIQAGANLSMSNVSDALNSTADAKLIEAVRKAKQTADDAADAKNLLLAASRT